MRPALLLLALPAVLAGCTPPAPRAVDALPLDATGTTASLAAMEDALDTPLAPAAAVPDRDAPLPVTAVGFAQVAAQPGETLNARRLMALRAARMDALRVLAEQVHGIRLSGSTSVADAVLTDDRIAGLIDGTIRGARTLRVTPRGEDGYEVELALDPDMVAYIVRSAALGRM